MVVLVIVVMVLVVVATHSGFVNLITAIARTGIYGTRRKANARVVLNAQVRESDVRRRSTRSIRAGGRNRPVGKVGAYWIGCLALGSVLGWSIVVFVGNIPEVTILLSLPVLLGSFLVVGFERNRLFDAIDFMDGIAFVREGLAWSMATPAALVAIAEIS